MGALAMPFETLPLGFRFKPTDVELIDHYLRLKINGKEDEVACIKEVDICRVEPWDLPDLSAIRTNDHEWFYFCPRDRKYPNGQRSNRATEAGYWKATGKDRTIKSRKMGTIGMKKTLVFYTGRAPKGQRTNWVIHEYRTTLQELDGSHPGQGAFVLCRLFKKADEIKQDENDDASHSDEVEANIPSPNPTNISQEEIRSEQAVVQPSPVSVEQSVEQQAVSEHCAVKPSDSMTSETMYPDHPPVTPEVDSRLYDPIIFEYEPHYKWQSMHANQGPVGMDDIFSTDIGDGHNGFHLQDIDGRDLISDFLDSVINPDVSVGKDAGHQGVPLAESDMWKNSSIKETGSCSGGSDVEVAQQQHDVGYVNFINSYSSYNGPTGIEELLQSRALADDVDIFSDDALDRFCYSDSGEPIYYNQPQYNSFVKTEDGQIVGHNGIKLRSHIGDRQLPPSNIPRQGNAPRRLRLQNSGYVGKESYPVVTDRSCSPINGIDSPDLSSTTVISPDDFLCMEDLDKNITATDESQIVKPDEVVETGIKIRNHRQRSRPSTVKTVEQGYARRRIRLLRQPSFNAKEDAAKPVAAEKRNLSKEVGEKQSAVNPHDGLDQNSSSFKRSVSVHMIMLMMVVFFFVACIGLWIARTDTILSS